MYENIFFINTQLESLLLFRPTYCMWI